MKPSRAPEIALKSTHQTPATRPSRLSVAQQVKLPNEPKPKTAFQHPQSIENKLLSLVSSHNFSDTETMSKPCPNPSNPCRIAPPGSSPPRSYDNREP
jgi:hypothetical protein